MHRTELAILLGPKALKCIWAVVPIIFFRWSDAGFQSISVHNHKFSGVRLHPKAVLSVPFCTPFGSFSGNHNTCSVARVATLKQLRAGISFGHRQRCGTVWRSIVAFRRIWRDERFWRIPLTAHHEQLQDDQHHRVRKRKPGSIRDVFVDIWLRLSFRMQLFRSV